MLLEIRFQERVEIGVHHLETVSQANAVVSFTSLLVMHSENTRLLVQYVVSAKEEVRLDYAEALSSLVKETFNLILIVLNSL